MNTTLLVLAAGMGSRYGGIKQLDRLGPSGETIMDYSIFDAIRAGFNKVVFVIRHDFAKEFSEIFIDKLQGRVDADVVFQDIKKIPPGFQLNPERQKPWGTAHAMLMAKEIIKEPFAVINADDFYGKESFATMADFLKHGYDKGSNKYAMCGYKLENTLSEHGTVSRGVCKVSSNGYLESVLEHVKIERNSSGKIISYHDSVEEELSPGELVSMNFWGFNPTIFDIIERDFEEFMKNNSMDLKSEIYTPKVVDDIIRRGQGSVKVLRSDAQWFGVTYQADKQLAVDNLRALAVKGQYPSNLWS